MFECEIEVKGDGVGRDGKFKHDKTGPVRQFMVDNVFLYPKVRKHIEGCKKCDPAAALEHYLERRRSNPKFKGSTSATLVKLALTYEKQFANSVPASLVNEFIWRSCNVETVVKYETRLSVRDLVRAAKHLKERQLTHAMPAPFVSKFQAVLTLLQHHAAPETDQEMEDLIQVAEVTLA